MRSWMLPLSLFLMNQNSEFFFLFNVNFLKTVKQNLLLLFFLLSTTKKEKKNATNSKKRKKGNPQSYDVECDVCSFILCFQQTAGRARLLQVKKK